MTANQLQPNERTRPIVGVIALAAILMAVLAGCGADDSSGDLETFEFGTVTVTGATLPPIDETTVGTGADAALGMTIPEISGADFYGNRVNIEIDGTPKAIIMVSHSCGHCQIEIPEIQAWIDETGGVEGVDLIAVSTSAAEVGGNWPPSEWFEREGWTSPVIVDDEDMAVFSAYGGWVIPYWVFTDSAGVVIGRWAGRLDIDTVESAMEQSLTW